jgi:hypothetical protein
MTGTYSHPESRLEITGGKKGDKNKDEEHKGDK